MFHMPRKPYSLLNPKNLLKDQHNVRTPHGYDFKFASDNRIVKSFLLLDHIKVFTPRMEESIIKRPLIKNNENGKYMVVLQNYLEFKPNVD